MPVLWSLTPPGSDVASIVYDYADVALSSVDGDLDVAITLITGGPAVAQHIMTRLRFVLGEWFLNVLEGIPYREIVWVKNPSESLVSALFRRVVEDTNGVKEVRRFIANFDHAARHLVAEFEAVLADGTVLSAPRTAFLVPTS